MTEPNTCGGFKAVIDDYMTKSKNIEDGSQL